MVAVVITRGELDAAGLRREAGLSKDGPAARRMLALALVLEGRSRSGSGEHVRDGIGRPCATGFTATMRKALQG